jgi:hypothetical protein
MPTPLEILLDPTLLILLGIYILLIVHEAITPVKKLKELKAGSRNIE